MRLRDRQREFSDRCHTALQMRGNTLGVAPTGAGKTVMLSHIVGRQKLPHGALVLQHRDELVRQNRHTFGLVNPAISTGLFTADRKEWGYGCIFAMVQTLAREDALAKMPKVDLVAVDEGHHAAADSYRRILAACHKLNPNLQTLLVSATPNRGDKKTLRGVIDNCADQITLRELIDAKHLVPPRSFVVDLGVRDQLDRVRRTASDFDMLEVEAIMDKQVLNDRVVEEWKNLAGDRQTVVFCSTVQHAEHVAEAFRAGGVAARVIDGSMPSGERARTLAAFDRCEFRVIVNVAVLTEGWDCQPVSCVILLRPSSYKSTMIQMIGRGLRKLDPERYPGRHKDDCIVIDFGTSILKHGDLEPRVNLHQGGSKECPECQSTVPAQSPECPVCNFVFPVPIVDQPDETDGNDEEEDEPDDPGAPEHLTDFRLTEIDLLIDKSPFKWEPLFDGLVLVASAFEASALVVSYYGRWYALGLMKGQPMRVLCDHSERLVSLASADDFLREHGDTDTANKAKRWINQPPTQPQLDMLGMNWQQAMGMTRYQATCWIVWTRAERNVKARLEYISQRSVAA